MNKMTINGIKYLAKPLSWSRPDGKVGMTILICYPEHEPNAEPIFLIDNNGTNPFGHMSYAQWVPTNDVHFAPPKNGEEVTW